MKRLLMPLFLLLGACSSTPPRHLPPVVDGRGGTPAPQSSPAPGVPYESPEDVVAIPMPAPAQSGGAVVALLDQADDYHRSGDTGNEAAVIERALRIDPKNAHLWARLAVVRFDQGRPEQAEQLALKSNVLAAGNRSLQARNWQLVARARWARNDSTGARAAEQKARDLGV